jgi:hypothetical protein
MANLDSDAVLHTVEPVALADACHAARVLLGHAPDGVGASDAGAVLGMLGVTAELALAHRPKRGRRRVVRKYR